MPGDADSDEEKATRLHDVVTGQRLVVFWNGGSGSYFLPGSGSMSIGRSPKCDIVINDESISRNHALLHAGPQVRIEDLGSSNGTTVGGVKIVPHHAVPIGPGTLVSLGAAMLVLHDALERTSQRATLTSAELRLAIESPMERILKLADLVARSDISVLLSGETGVGKEVFAERIHRGSGRAAAPLLKLNCAALPEPLLESELFGYERGAFTGANTAKKGLLESARGGTVFLDELGEMPMSVQAKLLRAIESREVLPLGALAPRPLDVRFVAATNRDLEADGAQGRFRRDLYFRLNGITILIPPLRERLNELPALVTQFVADASAKAGHPPVDVSPAAFNLLLLHAWPGNIRELRNVIERAVVLSAGQPLLEQSILLRPVGEHARPSIPVAAPALTVPPTPDHELGAEKQRIVDALVQAGGNQTEAAKFLGISRRTLVSRLGKHGIRRPRRRDDGQ